MKIIKNEQGFIVSVTAVIIAVILGLLVLYFSNSVSLNVTSSANNYSSSQARWSAISGIEDIINKLKSTGLTDIAGTYPFYNGGIIIDTATIDPVNQVMQITSKGTHAGSNRIFSLIVQASTGDTITYEDFDNDDDFDYGTTGKGKSGKGTFWGLSCDDGGGKAGKGGKGKGSDEGELPIYVLTGAEDCFFYGTKVQNNSFLEIDGLETEEDGDYILTLSLAVGVDVANVSERDDFQTGDYLEFFINDILIERWEGSGGGKGGGGNPMTPQVGNAINNLTTNFEDYSFNLTQIIGPVDEMELRIEAKTNESNKYIGIEGISLFETGGWDIITSGYKEI